MAFDHREFIRQLTSQPGVYKMLDDTGRIIYVGKAKNLKKRVSSYFVKPHSSVKTAVLVKNISNIEITITASESDALVLEHDLIKQLKPRYNVVLKDDKSFPYIRISNAEFPSIHFYRGSKRAQGKLFGPYPNAGAVRQSINTAQKLFMLRTCDESYFKNRSRPCLQYQIKRCSAPCVGKISQDAYQEDIHSAELFLLGKNQALVGELTQRMDAASERLDFELAARYRDQIQAMQRVLERQGGSTSDADCDVFGIAEANGIVCIYGLFVRKGQIIGSQAFFPKVPEDTDDVEAMASFVGQFYLGGRPIPDEVVSAIALDADLLALLSEKKGKRVAHRLGKSGDKAQWLKLAGRNAAEASSTRSAAKSQLEARFFSLQRLLELPSIPSRVECFDVSHTMGEATVASCVVFSPRGPENSAYRRYNIKGLTPGDDYGATRQALTRRFNPDSKSYTPPPDVLVIDGGAGQLALAESVLDEHNITETALIGVVKGEGRRAENDRLLRISDQEIHDLSGFEPARFLVQQIRDEAHRFAITGHRQRREKARRRSTLENIPGIGAKKRQNLINHLGGLPAVKNASKDLLQTVPGINEKLAELIFNAFHD